MTLDHTPLGPSVDAHAASGDSAPDPDHTHLSPEEIWTRTLAELRRHLSEVRAALAAGDLDAIPPFHTPAGLPQLPPGCLDAARSLVDEQNEVHAELRRAIDEHPAAARRPTPRAGTTRPIRFDARA